MEIDRKQIVELLRSRGDEGKADEAERELPATVDTDKHAGLLEKYGVDAKAVLGKLPGLPGGLGG